MRLRFQILSPNNTGAPDYIICGQASSNVTVSNTALKVVVDGEDIIDVVDLSTFNTLPNTVTTNNGIAIENIERVNTYFIQMDIKLDDVHDSTSVGIIASKAGYLTYNNSYEVYGYDLGNNPNETNGNSDPVDYNPSMDIFLINETDNLVNGKQQKAFSALTAFRKPFTDRVYMYNMCSSQGTIEYSAIDPLPVSGNGYICEDDTISIRQTNVVRDYVDNVLTVIDTCISAFIEVSSRQWIPTFNVSVSCNTNCPTDCDSTIESQNTASTFIDYTDITTVFVDDIEVHPFNEQTLEYKLIDFTGTEISQQSYSFNINPLPYTYDFLLYEFTDFVIPDVGDFVLKVIVGATDIYECFKNTQIKNCHWYEVQKTDCSSYTVVNRAFEDITLEVSKLDENKVFVLESTYVIPTLSTQDIVHTTDGVYEYKVIRGGETFIYLVFNYCAMQTCILSKISNIICDCNTDETCDKFKLQAIYYDFNAAIVTAITYFNMLNAEYNFNYMYDSISPNKLDELYNHKLLLDRFEEYCVTCDTDCGCL